MKNRGFSLIEIVVAVAIMGILSGIVGLQLRSYIAKSKDTKAVATLNTLRVAAQLYQLENEKPLIEDSSKYEDKEENTEEGNYMVYKGKKYNINKELWDINVFSETFLG